MLHAQLCASAMAWDACDDCNFTSPSDSPVSMNTIFRVGATVVFQPRFEPGEAIDLMLEHGVNTFHGVPQKEPARIRVGETPPVG